VDSEGGTGAAPLEFVDHVGTPLREGLVLARNCLVGCGLRNAIHLGASGRVVTGFDMTRLLALGADWCNAARGFMFALGCVQAQSCHTDRCPTGVATQNPWRQRAIVVDDKATRVRQFHHNTLAALADLVGAAGLTDPGELRPMHILRRVSPSESTLPMSYLSGPGELLAGTSCVRGTMGDGVPAAAPLPIRSERDPGCGGSSLECCPRSSDRITVGVYHNPHRENDMKQDAQGRQSSRGHDRACENAHHHAGGQTRFR
jgi:hypothetical protein